MHLPQLHRPIVSGLKLLSLWGALTITAVAGAEEPASSSDTAEPHPEPYPICAEKPTETQVEGAKGAYQAGTVSFQEADYERAILYWEDAFRRDCTAAKLLLNLARAYELAGKKEPAILALETFLERRPETSDRSSIERRIAFLRQDLERERLELAEARARARSGTPAADGGRADRPLWPVIAAGVGVAAAATGVALLVQGHSSGDADLQTAGILLCASGAGVGAGGALAWALTWSGPRGHAGRLAPVASPRLVGFSLEGNF